jgi:beta-glucosidase-like glycosyl hydrolase
VTDSLARLVFPALRWRRGSFAHEERRIARALAAGVGGFIIFGGTRAAVTTLTRALHRRAARPILIGADLERGAAQQVDGLTELPPAAALGFLDDLDATHGAGLITAREARAVGVTWAFGPVCDLDLETRNPIVQTRAFGPAPGRVAQHAGAWIRGSQEHGVLACAKHYPGHGRTTVDSHAELPRVPTRFDELRATDLVPFAAAVGDGVGSVMTAHVAYEGWDPSGAATFSPAIVGHLRGWGFDGVLVTDAFIMAGATAAAAEAPATVAAVAAGCDALLYPRDFEAVVRALDAAVGQAIPATRAAEALQRIDRAAAHWRPPTAGEDAPDLTAHRDFADSLADRALYLLTRGIEPALGPAMSVTLVDDDVGGPYAVGPRDVFERTLRAAGVQAGRGGRIVVVYAEPRSWKERADLGSRSVDLLARAAPGAGLIVLCGHPRLVTQLPGNAPVLCAWHGMPLMQRAAARWVAARSR